MKSHACTAAALFSAMILSTMSLTVEAQGIGPCNGTPGERPVGQENKIGYTVPICEFPSSSQGYGGRPAPQAMQESNNYAAIIWHPNARATWIGKNFRDDGNSEKETLKACEAAMGEGCKTLGVVWNSYVAIGTDPFGTLVYGIGKSERKAVADLKKACRANKLDGCVVIQETAALPFLDFQTSVDPSFPRLIEPQGDFRRRWLAAAIPDHNAPYRPHLDTLWVQGGFPSEEIARLAVLKVCQQDAKTTCAIHGVTADLDLFVAWDQEHARRLFGAPAALGPSLLERSCKKDGDQCLVILDYASSRSDLQVLQMGETAWQVSGGNMGYRIGPDGKAILAASPKQQASD